MLNRTAGPAPGPFVIAMDIGSSGTRAGLYDATGATVDGVRAKVSHTFTTDAEGTAVIDADEVLAEVITALDETTAKMPDGAAVAGVALDTFASSLVGVDAEGRATTPYFTYADTRCAPQVHQLRAEVDELDLQQRTGTRLHTSYLPARLRWLAEEQPEVFAATDTWLSLGEYLYLHLIGTTAAGTATAAWTGLLDRRRGTWDPEVLELSGITADQLSAVRDPDQPLTPVTSMVAERWPALAQAVWFPVIADGLAANLGVGADRPGVVGVSAATSGAMRMLVPEIPEHVPPGLWGYRISADRTLFGGAVSDIGRVAFWAERTLRIENTEVLDDVLHAPPTVSTPLVLPFLSGERSTGWAAEAQAHIVGLSAATTPMQIYRGALEGAALSLGRIARQLGSAAGAPQQILASGGMASGLPGWCQILADVLGAEVVHVRHRRSTLRGTALLALQALAPDVPRSQPETGQTFAPTPVRAGYYADRTDQFEQVYRALVATGEES